MFFHRKREKNYTGIDNKLSGISVGYWDNRLMNMASVAKPILKEVAGKTVLSFRLTGQIRGTVQKRESRCAYHNRIRLFFGK